MNKEWQDHVAVQIPFDWRRYVTFTPLAMGVVGAIGGFIWMLHVHQPCLDLIGPTNIPADLFLHRQDLFFACQGDNMNRTFVWQFCAIAVIGAGGILTGILATILG